MADIPKQQTEGTFSITQLCRAIAEQETHNCRDKTNSTIVNNCHGIKPGGKFKSYANKSQSYADCARIWTKTGLYSGGLPTIKDAQRWSGGDGVNWQRNVLHFYYTLK